MSRRPSDKRLGDERTEISWQLGLGGADIGPDGASDPLATHGAIPERIGPYRILRQLGQGGMGAVYLAEQLEPIQRRVAIKLIHPERMSRAALLRFDAERQALARMQHPNIAQIFEAGTTQDGHPFVVMEALEGEPITTYCDNRKLNLRQRLELFRQVCAGVQHAHQKGVLHRDLKPTNVLVVESDRGGPRVKLIDFGIAKALITPAGDESPLAANLTEGNLLGTPAYLSPESIDVPDQGADVRSDVYALGVLLYELLSAGRPFEQGSGSRVELLWRIVNEDPKRPSVRLMSVTPETRNRIAANRRLAPKTLVRALRRELDWLVLRAISKDKEDRYPAVSELDDDISRYLAHRPLRAGSPGGVARLRKLIRRNRVVLAATAIVILTLIAGIVARTLEAQRANREAVAARQVEEESEQVVRFLMRMFDRADPMRSISGDAMTARDVLDWGIETIGKDEHVRSPAVRVKLLAALAEVSLSLGENEKARELADQALANVEPEGPLGNPNTVFILSVKAMAEARLGDAQAAEAAFRRALDMLEQEHDGELRASVLMNVGMFYAQQGRFEEAETHFRRGLAVKDRDHLRFAAPINHARHLSNFGGILARAGKFEEAESVLRQGYQYTAEQLDAEHPLHAFLALNLGNVLLDRDRAAEAVPLYREGLALMERQPQPQLAVVSGAMANLARASMQLGEREEALELLRRAVEIRQQIFGAEHPATLQVVAQLEQAQLEAAQVETAQVEGEGANSPSP